MPPLVVDDIVRLTFEATLNGRPIATIMDVDVIPGIGRDRSDTSREVAEDAQGAWQDHIVEMLTDHYVFTGTSYVDLNTEDGSTGEVAPDGEKPIQGATAADVMAPQVQYLIHKNLDTSSRGARSGRLYLPGVFESSVDDAGIVNTDTREQFDDQFEDFKDGVNAVILGEFAREQNLAVVHNPAVGDPSSTRIATFTTDAMVATQKRRLGR